MGRLYMTLFPQDLIADYACTCAPGYTGMSCSVDVDECIDAECPGNSTCIQGTPGTFQCICNEGFEGELCTGKQY